MSEANLNGSITIPNEAIAQRAYQIWELRGCPEGDGSDNWETAYEQLSTEAHQTECEIGERRGPLLRLWDRFRSRAA